MIVMERPLFLGNERAPSVHLIAGKTGGNPNTNAHCHAMTDCVSCAATGTSRSSQHKEHLFGG